MSSPRTRLSRPPARRGAALLAVACVTLLAFAPAPAGADDDRDGFDFGTPPVAPETTPADPSRPGASKPPPGTEGGLAEELGHLRHWPERVGQRAAESLFLRGAEAIPHLVAILRGEDAALQPGAAWVLGKVGEPVHVQVILTAAAQRMNGSSADVFFKAAYGLSPTETKRWLISFLSLSNRPVFRKAATRFLATKLTPQDQDQVVDLLDARKASVRIAGLQLLYPAGVMDAEARYVQALSDLWPEVSYAAARLLAARASDDRIARLNALARDGSARERAYATLALVESARLTGDARFEEATLESLAGRRGLLHPERLSRGAAACGLAYGGIGSQWAEIVELLDSTVVETLIEIVGGAHYRDYESVKSGAFAALRKLSGQDLTETAVAWAQWWRQARGSFRARRPLQELDAVDVPRAFVELSSIQENGLRRRAEFISASAPARDDVLFLRAEAFQALVEFLKEMGIFASQEGAAARADQHVAVTVGIANQRRSMTLTPEDDVSDPQKRYARLALRMDALLEANEWQRYVDTDRFANRKVWWERNVEAMAKAAPDERRSMLMSAIVYAFDDLPDEPARAHALYRLQNLGARLPRTEAQILAEELTRSPSFGAMEADGLTWIMVQGHDDLGADLMKVLARRSESRALDLLGALLAEAGVERVREAFADPLPGIRAGAAHATRLLLEGHEGIPPDAVERARIEERLRPGLEVLAGDASNPGVSIRALLALAYIGDPQARPGLELLYKGGNLKTKLEVTRALGYVPGREAHPFLTRVLNEENIEGSGALRAAALEAMARSRHKDAVRLLGYYLLNDRNPQVREAAAKALGDMGTEDARFELVDLLTQGQTQPARRARLVDALGRFEGEVVVDQLKRHLADPAPEVVSAAALRAAEHGVAEAVPYLTRTLRRGAGSERDRAVTALRVLTSVTYDDNGYSVLADRYDAWYDLERTGNARTWFRDALKRQGYDVSQLGAYVQGREDLGAVPMMIRVLRDNDPVLRRNANEAIEDLTGRSFGDIDVATMARGAEEIAARWTAWLARRDEAPAPAPGAPR